jgi:hypothetical protein
MSNEFRTRSGICTITSEQISFSRPDSGSPRRSSRASLLAVLFASLLFGLGIFLFLVGNALMGVIFVILGLGLRWQQVRANTVAPNIPRQAIRKVEARAPAMVFAPGDFVVYYDLGNRFVRQRIIVQGGNDEYLHAVEVMRAAGLLQA